MTWTTYSTSSTTYTAPAANYFRRNATNQPVWSTSTGSDVYDCSGVAGWVLRHREEEKRKEMERKRKEDEMMKAFDEVFNG